MVPSQQCLLVLGLVLFFIFFNATLLDFGMKRTQIFMCCLLHEYAKLFCQHAQS